jgi:glycosyltransferase involved in cell wall biosynthesis
MSVYRNDVPEHLFTAIKSIWTDQIHKPDEIVIIIDGPIDESLKEVISHWSNELKDTIKVIWNEKNQGLACSLNHGLLFCSGDYIARMDSDDISMPNRFLLQYNYILNYPNVTVLGGAIEEFSVNPEKSFIKYYPEDDLSIRRYLPKGSPFAHPSVVIKREVLIRNKYQENLNAFKKNEVSSNEDIELWFRLVSQNYSVANLRDVVLRFRKNQNFYKRRNANQAIMELKLFWNGTYQLFGFSYLLFFPLLRFFSRLMPVKVINYFYNKRNLILK